MCVVICYQIKLILKIFYRVVFVKKKDKIIGLSIVLVILIIMLIIIQMEMINEINEREK